MAILKRNATTQASLLQTIMDNVTARSPAGRAECAVTQIIKQFARYIADPALEITVKMLTQLHTNGARLQLCASDYMVQDAAGQADCFAKFAQARHGADYILTGTDKFSLTGTGQAVITGAFAYNATGRAQDTQRELIRFNLVNMGGSWRINRTEVLAPHVVLSGRLTP